MQKGSLIAYLHEKTATPLKLQIARVEDIKDGELDLVEEKMIESAL